MVSYDDGGEMIDFSGIMCRFTLRSYTDNDYNDKPDGEPIYTSQEHQAFASDDMDLYGSLVRIPKEEIDVNPETDYKYGILEVTVTTPEQGSFSAWDTIATLYED